MHDIVLIMCTAVLSASVYAGCSRVADAVSGFSVEIVRDGNEPVPAVTNNQNGQ